MKSKLEQSKQNNLFRQVLALILMVVLAFPSYIVAANPLENGEESNTYYNDVQTSSDEEVGVIALAGGSDTRNIVVVWEEMTTWDGVSIFDSFSLRQDFLLLADGDPVSAAATLPRRVLANQPWTTIHTFPNMPILDNNGDEIVYSIGPAGTFGEWNDTPGAIVYWDIRDPHVTKTITSYDDGANITFTISFHLDRMGGLDWLVLTPEEHAMRSARRTDPAVRNGQFNWGQSGILVHWRPSFASRDLMQQILEVDESIMQQTLHIAVFMRAMTRDWILTPEIV